ncbi:hypothetical protein V6N12_059092 [Hibiscus sabdariffa]|uniref:Uncharacterized protein n=1 Tax=Hibiscus sabdariffa TaxID=183260 RepID=A0ABR2EW26_9ROSI
MSIHATYFCAINCVGGMHKHCSPPLQSSMYIIASDGVGLTTFVFLTIAHSHHLSGWPLATSVAAPSRRRSASVHQPLRHFLCYLQNSQPPKTLSFGNFTIGSSAPCHSTLACSIFKLVLLDPLWPFSALGLCCLLFVLGLCEPTVTLAFF